MFEGLVYKFKELRVKFVSDEKYLTKRFKHKLGYMPNFNQPKSFNEKVTARMIFERNELHTKLADKLNVRTAIEEKIGKEYLVPLLGIYHNFKEINFDNLPKRFVLKCTHDSGSAIICSDKCNFKIENAKKKLKKHLKMNQYILKREWHYKGIPRYILAEQFVDLYEYTECQLKITTCRVHCFEGVVKFIEIDVSNSSGNEFSNIYDIFWNLQPFTVDLKGNTPVPLKKPKQFEEMLDLAEKLALDTSYSRIDFLLSQNGVFFSEITLTPNAGRMVIQPAKWDYELGTYWKNIEKLNR